MFPLHAIHPRRRAAVVAALLVLANTAVFVLELGQPSSRALTEFVRRWGLIPAKLWQSADRETWQTVFTSMFLHGGWLHLAGNCWFLWLFGANVEDRLGRLRFVAFYALSGLGAAAVQVAVDPFSATVMIGASGAISGILGAYLRFFPTTPILTLVPLWFAPLLPVPAFIYIALWFGVQFWQGIGSVSGTDITGGIAWWAHVGGFLTGFAMAGWMQPRKRA